jgi:peptide/nickel transport system permease protein
LSNKQLISRIGQFVLVLLGISFLTFALTMLSPGDPVKQMLTGGEDVFVTAAQVEELRHELGLDKPFIFQYFDWLYRTMHGDLGFSFMAKLPVVDKLWECLPATILLSLTSLAFMLLVAIPAGIVAAVRQNTWVDYLIRSFTFLGVSIPGFWLGLMLLWILGLHLGWLPIVGGRVALDTIILPALTLGIAMASKYTRQVRTVVLEELHQDYVMGARARGMNEGYILWKEVLPNAMLPLITLLGLSLGSLLGGAAVVEMVFSWPGLGRLAVEAINYRDFNLIQGVILWIACMYMIINLLVDASYHYFDPRLRMGEK